ncbi:hypothetical protein A3Q56_04813 [Intoshia linei]|uniref:Ferrochelatase n=1 Tax=Intoshia linei TaxID=1819745 RepID=A0A177AZP4_9BILA|nr:hypothetical protein A3Q56_04813 [Intoshia linei]
MRTFTGSLLAKIKLKKAEKRYAEIGGSPIYEITKSQGLAMENLINRQDCKFYTAFRYVHPRLEHTLAEMKKDGITDAIAFSQYPQYSCTTTGSSLNEIADFYKTKPSKIKWSAIDTWSINKHFISAWSDIIKNHLLQFDSAVRSEVHLIFSAHSLPINCILKGDPYYNQVSATVYNIMQKLGFKNKFNLSWQSKEGPLKWLAPSTVNIVKNLHSLPSVKYISIIPISFVNDHIETLHELDIEIVEHYNKKSADPRLFRVPSLNTDKNFIRAISEIVTNHIEQRSNKNKVYESLSNYHICIDCKNPRDHQPKILLWKYVDLQCADKLIQKTTTDQIHRYLESESKENFPILKDLLYYAVQFAKNQKYTAAKLSTVSRHKILETYFDNTNNVVKYINELLLCHSIKRPPFCIDLYSQQEILDISTYIMNSYIRNIKLYKYVFTKMIRLDLSITYLNDNIRYETFEISKNELSSTQIDDEMSVSDLTEKDSKASKMESENQEIITNSDDIKLNTMVDTLIQSEMKRLNLIIEDKVKHYEAKMQELIKGKPRNSSKKNKK